jgi:hypothetical protein
MLNIRRRKGPHLLYFIGVAFFLVSHVVLISHSPYSSSSVSFDSCKQVTKHVTYESQAEARPLSLFLLFYYHKTLRPLKLVKDATVDAKATNELRGYQTLKVLHTDNVAIVITVHGALDYVVSCLESWEKYTKFSQVLLVDDCETTDETRELEDLACSYENVTVIPKIGTGSAG